LPPVPVTVESHVIEYASYSQPKMVEPSSEQSLNQKLVLSYSVLTPKETDLFLSLSGSRRLIFDERSTEIERMKCINKTIPALALLFELDKEFASNFMANYDGISLVLGWSVKIDPIIQPFFSEEELKTPAPQIIFPLKQPFGAIFSNMVGVFNLENAEPADIISSVYASMGPVILARKKSFADARPIISIDKIGGIEHQYRREAAVNLSLLPSQLKSLENNRRIFGGSETNEIFGRTNLITSAAALKEATVRARPLLSLISFK